MYLIDDQQSRKDFESLLDENIQIEIKNNIVTVLSGDYQNEQFEIVPEYSDLIARCEEIELESFIFGKDSTEGIVSIEVKNDTVFIFKVDGTIEKRPMIYWILSAYKVNSTSKRLRGKSHYKFIHTFKTAEEKSKFFNANRKKDLYQVWDDQEAAMLYYGLTYFKGLKVEDVSVLSFDIEADSLNQTKNSKIFLITNTFFKNGNITKKHFRVDHYNDNCGAMIEDWCEWVREIDPQVITGHNIFGYDLPYLNHVAKLYDSKMFLGKDDSEITFAKKDSNYRVDGSQVWKYKKSHIFGREIIDGIFTSVKHDIGRNYPTWGLKSIAEYEGFVKEDRQFYDASLIGKNWHIPEEREKIVAYGIDDSDDSLEIYKLQIPSLFYMSQSIPKPFQTIICSASGSWLNFIMVRGYLQNNHSIPKKSDMNYVAGGMSHGVPGVYSNVSKWDAASYYPSTIMAFGLYDKVKDPNGYYLKMVTYFTNRRFDQKRKYKETGDSYWNDLQASSKVFINSSYGLMGTTGLNFNNFEIAAEITRCCRMGLQKCIVWATGKPIDYWWGVDEKLYKKITIKKSDYIKTKEKYDNAIEIIEDNGNELLIWVPKEKSGDSYITAYKHKRTASQDYADYSHIDSKAELSFDEMPKHDYILTNIDTDSLSFAKKDNSEWSSEEYEMLAKEINQIMYSDWEDDGEFERFVVVKAKNYAMLEKNDDKMKIKGSSFLSSTKEPALTEMLQELLQSFIDNKDNQYEIYMKYVKEACNIQDISRWATKKSITETLMEANDTSKLKVLAALEGKDFSVGDKVFLFNDIDGEIQDTKKGEPVFSKMKKKEWESAGLEKLPIKDDCTHSDRTFCSNCNPHLMYPKMVPNKIYRTVDDFCGSYDKFHYLERVYKTVSILEPILDISRFLNYNLKSNREIIPEEQ